MGGRRIWSRRGGPATHDVGRSQQSLWRSLWPFLVVLAAGLLVAWTWHGWRGWRGWRGWYGRGGGGLDAGALIGAGSIVLLVLVLGRQALALRASRARYDRLNGSYGETVALNRELRAAWDELQAHNQALVEANAHALTLATTDPLTTLPNYRAIVAALDHELERAHRYNRPCAVLFLELDHVHVIGRPDGYGRPASEGSLHEFASLVRFSLRGVDILGHWAGEELVALLPETELAAALAAAEHVRASVAAHPFSSADGAHLTCSIGVAAYPHDGVDRPALVDAAGRAAHAATRLGRNQARAAGEPAVAALEGGASLRDEAGLTGAVELLASLVEARDRYTGRHTQEVAALTVRLALALGCDAGQARLISLAGRLHDVGKVAIPDAVLQKSGRLSAEEWALIRLYPGVGADVVGRVPALRAVGPMVRLHHERWDGTGYPGRLAGEAIPLGARVIAVADAYGAMTTKRPYREAYAPALALRELRRCAGTQFDPAVVAALERVLVADPTLTGGEGVA